MAFWSASHSATAQNCTTQSKLLSGTRETLAQVALSAATGVRNGDLGAVASTLAPELRNNPNLLYLLRMTGEKIANDSLAVTQLYELDANAVVPGSDSTTEFNCKLVGVNAATIFTVNGLQRGLYAFAMVEASGDRPYVISMLLRQQAGAWKLAGFYPHDRAARGHDGLWHWKDARERVVAARPNASWLGWVEYGLAETLLRPAAFVTTTHLEKLRGERAEVQPAELRDSLSNDVLFLLRGRDNAGYAITQMDAVGTEDGKRLYLSVHYRVGPIGDPDKARQRNVALVKALMDAHADLKGAFDGVMVFADPPDGADPFATEVTGEDASARTLAP